MQFQNHPVAQTLHSFQSKFLKQYQERHHSLPEIEHDQEWCSPCEQFEADNGALVTWKPTPCSDDLAFDNMEHALGFELHLDIKAFYASFYSGNLSAKTVDGELELLQVWNQDDFTRLQENLLGHIMMKQKKKQAVTLFLAVTDHDDIIISMQNDTGEIWAESVGKEPHKFLAQDLASFIDQLTPVVN
ncbi:SecY-interacting protein [Sansalvadorimonas sp. 2012CJ34-2]|uniref:Protein Syd n=1 Tax=Parendozoicomonas callyspongiae TaxID=2942213 RepID=A0ABT0PJL6_9GAMM|nr:SecY-interacting protein [Sansalvadorimonas sp. 2012CJ34-2]MCL6271426.1 SecY-interacting protein [Sansalvadorimonas sp. 2012CJ34-2]